MTNCPSCGAHTPAGASWCGQCFQPLATSGTETDASSGADASAPIPASDAGFGAVDRFGIARTATPSAPGGDTPAQATPGEPVVDRFGIVQPAAAAAAAVSPAGVSTLTRPMPVPTQFGGPGVPVEPTRTGTLEAWGWGSTGMTVIAAILFGGFIQLVFVLLHHHWGDNTSKEVDTAIAILVTFYCLVGAVVIQRVTVGGVRLFWTNGKPLEGVLIGAGIGISLGLAALLINSMIAGHLATDPWATMMASEGDAPHILVAILLSMIAAPLVEESLFRGLFAESLRPKGMAAAIWLSGLAFAFWHWRFSELRYYSLMGAMFAVLYFKRGLVCSMTTHACFNGVLTITAVILALQPGATFTFDGASLSAPRGWHHASQSEGVPSTLLGLDGPSGSAVALMSEPLPPTVHSITDPSVISQIQSRLSTSPYGGAFDTSQLVTMELPAGQSVEIPFLVNGYHAEEVFVQAGDKLVVLIYHSAGSAKADHDFQQMLQSLRVS